MIKVIRLTALAAVFTFFGCSEEPVVLPSHETEGEELVEFTVTVSGSQTKLTGTDDMSFCKYTHYSIIKNGPPI